MPKLALPSEPEFNQYRPISPWAVATLLVGLAAPLALIGPPLWIVPLLAAPLGWLGFKQLQRQDIKYIGQTALVAGLCFAALFFGWGVTQRLSRELRIGQEAEQFATSWLQLVGQGKLREAHQLQSAASRRVELGTDLVSYYEVQTEAAKDLETFRSTQPLASLAGRGNDVKLAFAEVVNHQNEGLGDYVTLRYEVTAGKVEGSDGSIWISAKRDRRPETGGADWQITSVTNTPPAKN
jgi:hypothetical protein